MIASRRRFLKTSAAIAASGSVAMSGLSAVASTEDSNGSQREVATNKSLLAASAFYPLPMGSIAPRGWLKRQLQIQADGLGGHLDEVWADVGPNSGWLGGTGESWERGPYFVDGLLPLAYQLDDAKLKAKAQRFIEWTLTHQQPNGMIGPASNDDWWPRMVMLKVLTQYEEATGDPRVMPLMARYFKYQLETLPTRPLRDWGKFRWQDNALSAIWLYNRTGDESLLTLAKLLHEQGHDWQAQFADFKYTEPVTPERIHLDEKNGLGDTALSTHGVNNGQALKAAPVWSLLSGKEEDRKGMEQMLAALDKYHGLPNGMFSCDEHFAGRNPSQGSELCTVVEAMYSLEVGMSILGDASLGDRLEQLAFNALPGAFTDDMWAHQYNQEPNQVEVSLHRKPWTTDGPESNIYGLEPNFGCCTANFHQGWPKFTNSLWMASADGGLVAAAYSPCEVNTKVHSVPVRLVEATDYPFRGTIHVAVSPARPLKFSVRLRIPGWASSHEVMLNGKAVKSSGANGFIHLEREWHAGDTVELRLPMEPRVLPGFHQSVSIHRGPLVFSYAIGGSWLKLVERDKASDWQVYPATAWNYALDVSASSKAGLKVEELPIGDAPFSLRGAPVRIMASAHKVPSWRAEDGVAAAVPVSPVSAADAPEMIALHPYAAGKLRITAFPVKAEMAKS
ncbi:glycoside hydrolase family 127 protein [Granulicella aggregans]|uniref:glycoside hydrolase family 127 protein n=1 Tax=Granulicella aggregans TaxID=474949 RepID=UPI0021E04EF7|nr:glycoside hydrolase family 127 protein [Granulicella aggregans]